MRSWTKTSGRLTAAAIVACVVTAVAVPSAASAAPAPQAFYPIVGQEFPADLPIDFGAPEGTRLQIDSTTSASGLPAGMENVGDSLSGTPETGTAGDYAETVRAYDIDDTSKRYSATIAVHVLKPPLVALLDDDSSLITDGRLVQGEKITVSGFGLVDGSRVAVALGTTDLGAADVSPAGAWAIPVTVPATAPNGSAHLVVTYTLPAGAAYRLPIAITVAVPTPVSSWEPVTSTGGAAVPAGGPLPSWNTGSQATRPAQHAGTVLAGAVQAQGGDPVTPAATGIAGPIVTAGSGPLVAGGGVATGNGDLPAGVDPTTLGKDLPSIAGMIAEYNKARKRLKTKTEALQGLLQRIPKARADYRDKRAVSLAAMRTKDALATATPVTDSVRQAQLKAQQRMALAAAAALRARAILLSLQFEAKRLDAEQKSETAAVHDQYLALMQEITSRLAKGDGRLPQGTTVTMTLHSTPVVLGSTTVNATGGWAIFASVPAVEPGPHTVILTFDLPGGGTLTQRTSTTVKAAPAAPSLTFPPVAELPVDSTTQSDATPVSASGQPAQAEHELAATGTPTLPLWLGILPVLLGAVLLGARRRRRGPAVQSRRS